MTCRIGHFKLGIARIFDLMGDPNDSPLHETANMMLVHAAFLAYLVDGWYKTPDALVLRGFAHYAKQ